MADPEAVWGAEVDMVVQQVRFIRARCFLWFADATAVIVVRWGSSFASVLVSNCVVKCCCGCCWFWSIFCAVIAAVVAAAIATVGGHDGHGGIAPTAADPAVGVSLVRVLPPLLHTR